MRKPQVNIGTIILKLNWARNKKNRSNKIEFCELSRTWALQNFINDEYFYVSIYSKMNFNKKMTKPTIGFINFG